jgi:uncharacterized membrane protein YdjX (TVP38/TMEM64 family)
VLGGALFGTKVALITAGMCTAVGSTNCYIISWTFGQTLVHQYFAEKLRWWKHQVAQHQHRLFSYIFVLRLTPIFPGWFLNIAAPHIGIPIGTFFVSTLCGILPTSFLYAQAGEALEKLSTGQDITVFTPVNVVMLVSVSVLVVVSNKFAPLQPRAHEA